jgi:glycosyltransferase involved in cell wall biosynthesis
MHVAFTIAGLGAGGAERVLSLITAAWVVDRLVTIISFDSCSDLVFHSFDPRVRIVRLDIPHTRSGLLKQIVTAIRRTLRLRRTLRELNPDIVISFLTKINVLTLLASLGMRHPVIISERNNPQMQASNVAWRALLSRLHWRASGVVMQTRDSLVCLKGRARQRAQVISNPVEIPGLTSPKIGPPVLAAVGRLTAQKGFDLLIEAFAAVAPSHPDWTLRIWGEGELRHELERQVKDLGLEHRVDLPGVSRDPAEWIRDADAFVFSSRYEGFGNALAEAAASGLAVVSFDCPFGPSDIIDHDRTGLLVPPGDIAALSAALDRVMSDELLRKRLGEAARADMSRFAPGKIIAQWDALLVQVLLGASKLPLVGTRQG